MNSGDEAILLQLEEAAGKAGVEIRYENLDDEELSIGSGFCRLHDQPVLIVDKRLKPLEKWRILARELKSMNLDGIYLPPQTRDIIESA